MKIVGKILHIAFIIFLIWQSIQLASKIIVIDYSGSFQSLIIDAILLNIFITGIFTIVYSFSIYKILPKSYYEIKNVRQLNYLNKLFKIELFRSFLRLTIWTKKNNKNYFFNGTRKGFPEFEENTKKSEFGHFLPFIIILLIVIYMAIYNAWEKALLILVFDFIFNFYPFILQRFIRMRLARVKNNTST